jgi:hypothetical protein
MGCGDIPPVQPWKCPRHILAIPAPPGVRARAFKAIADRPRAQIAAMQFHKSHFLRPVLRRVVNTRNLNRVALDLIDDDVR